MAERISSPQPKWVNATDTQTYLPSQKTPVLNLFLAGAHTKTQAQVWSIEGAVESGRRAANAIDGQVISLYGLNCYRGLMIFYIHLKRRSL